MKKLIILLLIIPVVTALQFCTSAKKAAASEPKITYVTNIQPVMVASCSPCHFPPNGKKMHLDTYSSVSSVIDDILSRIQKDPSERGFMPMKHPKLADSTINMFIQWQKDGLLEK